MAPTEIWDIIRESGVAPIVFVAILLLLPFAWEVFKRMIRVHNLKRRLRRIPDVWRDLREKLGENLEHEKIEESIYKLKHWWRTEILGASSSGTGTRFRELRGNDRGRSNTLFESQGIQSKDFSSAFQYLRHRFHAKKIERPQNWSTDVGAHNSLIVEQEFTAVVQNVSFKVTGYHLGHIPMLRVETKWPDKSFRLRIMEEKISKEEKKFRGMQDIEVGIKDFDRTYILQSNDESTLKSILNRDVCDLISELGKKVRLANRNGSLGLISISGGNLQIEWLQEFRNKQQGRGIARVIKHMGLLYQGMAAAEGKLCFDVADVSINELSSICMVCGEAIDAEPVRCRNCKTPHHEDCWDYMGSCSTFACGSKVFEKVEEPQSGLQADPRTDSQTRIDWIRG